LAPGGGHGAGGAAVGSVARRRRSGGGGVGAQVVDAWTLIEALGGTRRASTTRAGVGPSPTMRQRLGGTFAGARGCAGLRPAGGLASPGATSVDPGPTSVAT